MFQTRTGSSSREEHVTLPPEPRTTTFILRLQLGGPHFPIGSIEPANGSTSLSFRGWMDFMGALNQLHDEFGSAERRDEA